MFGVLARSGRHSFPTLTQELTTYSEFLPRRGGRAARAPVRGRVGHVGQSAMNAARLTRGERVAQQFNVAHPTENVNVLSAVPEP